VPKLLKSIDKIEDDLFNDELKDIKKHISDIYIKKEHRYLTFYHIAKDVKDKGYLVLAISLIFEGIGFYIKSAFSALDEELDQYFDEFEEKIEQGDLTYYDLTNLTRAIFLIRKDKLNKINKHPFDDKKDKFYQLKDRFCFDYHKDKFIKLIRNIKDLRNNLLHANAGETIENVKMEVNNLLNEYERLIIKDNYLSNKI
jgi:hypothetical protein